VATRPKKYFTCRVCGLRKRSRQDLEICHKCRRKDIDAALRNDRAVTVPKVPDQRARAPNSEGLPEHPVLLGRKEFFHLEWTISREAWFHELLFRQVEFDGLRGLGLGRLRFLSERQREDRRMGKYTDRNRNEYDILLRDDAGRAVCIEVKKVADEHSIAQILRYKAALKKAFKEPVMILVAIEFPEKALDVLRELRELGWASLKAYRFTIEDSTIALEGVDLG